MAGSKKTGEMGGNLRPTNYETAVSALCSSSRVSPKTERRGEMGAQPHPNKGDWTGSTLGADFFCLKMDKKKKKGNE
jgi:hypothetical protein